MQVNSHTRMSRNTERKRIENSLWVSCLGSQAGQLSEMVTVLVGIDQGAIEAMRRRRLLHLLLQRPPGPVDERDSIIRA